MDENVQYLSRGWNKYCELPDCLTLATQQWLNDDGEVRLYTCDSHGELVLRFQTMFASIKK